MHHNITLLRIHSQQSEAFGPKLFPLFWWFIWKLCGAEREKLDVELKIIKCNSRMKKKISLTICMISKK